MAKVSKEHLFELKNLEEWKNAIREEIDDIKTWRGREAERVWRGGWGRAPHNLVSRTIALCAWLPTILPGADTAPLMDLSEAVQTWHQERSAANIVVDKVLERWCVRAIALLSSAERVILASSASGAVLSTDKNFSARATSGMPGHRGEVESRERFIVEWWKNHPRGRVKDLVEECNKNFGVGRSTVLGDQKRLKKAGIVVGPIKLTKRQRTYTNRMGAIHATNPEE